MGEGEGATGAAKGAGEEESGRIEGSTSPASGRPLAAIPGSQEKAIAEEWDLCSGSISGGQVGCKHAHL